MTSRYRLTCVDRTGASLGRLPNAVLEESLWELNGPGYIKYTMNQTDDQINVPQEHANEVMLHIDNNPVPANWGYHEDTENSGMTARFTAPGLLAYMGGRYVTNTGFYYGYDTNHNPIGAGVEQLDIAADLWRQKSYNFNIGVYPYAPSGVTRLRQYSIFDHQNILEALQDFPDTQDSVGNFTGFDFAVEWDSNLNRFFRLYYPQIGSVKSDVLLEWGRNITDFTVVVKGSSQANRVYYTGGANGDVKFENHFEATSNEMAPYGAWEKIVTQSSENDLTTLLQLAQRYVNTHKFPVQMPDITCIETPDALLGVVKPGDIVPVVINRGRVQLNSMYRIQSISWQPPNTLKMVLIDPLEQAFPVIPGTWRGYPSGVRWQDVSPTTRWQDLEGP